MSDGQTSKIKTSVIFIAAMAVTAVVAYIYGSAGTEELINYKQFSVFSMMLGLLAGIVLAYAIANFVLKEKFREKLLSDAITDPGSGLYTRHYMNEVAPRYVALHQRDPKAGFAISIIELSGAEVLQRKHGKQFVSAAFLSLATLVMESIRETDIAVDFGTYRVAVFSTCGIEEQASRTLERIINEVEGWKVPASEHELVGLTVKSAQVIHRLDESFSETLSRVEDEFFLIKTSHQAAA